MDWSFNVPLKPLAVCLALAALALLLLVLATPGTTSAAGNPSGSGQPSVECGEDNPVEPAGFSRGGFAIAETMYAGSGRSVDHAGSDHAVSQYDVACYQLSNPPH